MKLFKTYNIDIVRNCQKEFAYPSPLQRTFLS